MTAMASLTESQIKALRCLSCISSPGAQADMLESWADNGWNDDIAPLLAQGYIKQTTTYSITEKGYQSVRAAAVLGGDGDA